MKEGRGNVASVHAGPIWLESANCRDMRQISGFYENWTGPGSMTTFDERKDAYENKFAHDAELKFRAEARRNRLLGKWAAGELGKDGPEADAYALTVVQADLEEAGDEDVFRKVRADFDAAGLAKSDAEIREQMDKLLITAAEQIEKEG